MDSQADYRGVDLLTSVLRCLKDLLLEKGGRATDEDLIEIERRFRQEYAGCRVYIGERQATEERYRRIARDVEAGLSCAEAARRNRCSPRTVRRALATYGLKMTGNSCQSDGSHNLRDPK